MSEVNKANSEKLSRLFHQLGIELADYYKEHEQEIYEYAYLIECTEPEEEVFI